MYWPVALWLAPGLVWDSPSSVLKPPMRVSPLAPDACPTVAASISVVHLFGQPVRAHGLVKSTGLP